MKETEDFLFKPVIFMSDYCMRCEKSLGRSVFGFHPKKFAI